MTAVVRGETVGCENFKVRVTVTGGTDATVGPLADVSLLLRLMMLATLFALRGGFDISVAFVDEWLPCIA